MFCPSCGYKMNGKERFCNACGTLMVHGPKVRGNPVRTTSFVDPVIQIAKDESKTFNRAVFEKAEKAENEAVRKAAKQAAIRTSEGQAAKEAAQRASKDAAKKKAAAEKADGKEKAAQEAVENALSDIEKTIKEAARRTAAKDAFIKRAEAKRAAKMAEAAKKAAIKATRKQVAAEEAAAKTKAAQDKAAEEAVRKAVEEKAAEDAADIESVPSFSHLRCKINGSHFPFVTMTLDENQSIFTQPSNMVWINTGISMETGTERDGKPFTATYTAHAAGQQICIASPFSGEILPLDIGKGAVIVQKSAFLAAQVSASLSAYICMHPRGEHTQGSLDFQQLSGSGTAVVAISGSLIECNLGSGEVIKVNTACIAAFEARVAFQTEIISAFQNLHSDDNGLFLSTLTGPGKVWLQTISAPA